MGASQEIKIPLINRKFNLVDGNYLFRDEVEIEAPVTLKIWDEWVDAQRDPGCCDSYKVIRDGKIVWVCECFMPPAIVKLLIDELTAATGKLQELQENL